MLFLSPPSVFPSSGDRRYLHWQLWSSFTDMLGSYHKWLTKTSINYSAEDSRDSTSSEFSLVAGFQQCEASFWLQVR